MKHLVLLYNKRGKIKFDRPEILVLTSENAIMGLGIIILRFLQKLSKDKKKYI
jgi:hypothetical protein